MKENLNEKKLKIIFKKIKSKSIYNRKRILSKILNDIKKNNYRNKNHLINIVIDEVKKI
tara:strand:- start:621 stop:797 length:177 start_codon:yes stop_codon:yes gene_type:complete